ETRVEEQLGRLDRASGMLAPERPQLAEDLRQLPRFLLEWERVPSGRHLLQRRLERGRRAQLGPITVRRRRGEERHREEEDGGRERWRARRGRPDAPPPATPHHQALTLGLRLGSCTRRASEAVG